MIFLPRGDRVLWPDRRRELLAKSRRSSFGRPILSTRYPECQADYGKGRIALTPHPIQSIFPSTRSYPTRPLQAGGTPRAGILYLVACTRKSQVIVVASRVIEVWLDQDYPVSATRRPPDPKAVLKVSFARPCKELWTCRIHCHAL